MGKQTHVTSPPVSEYGLTHIFSAGPNPNKVEAIISHWRYPAKHLEPNCGDMWTQWASSHKDITRIRNHALFYRARQPPQQELRPIVAASFMVRGSVYVHVRFCIHIIGKMRAGIG